MGNQKRQLFVPGPLIHQKRQLCVSFSCYPFSLTRFGATELKIFALQIPESRLRKIEKSRNRVQDLQGSPWSGRISKHELSKTDHTLDLVRTARRTIGQSGGPGAAPPALRQREPCDGAGGGIIIC